jgi:hypothetical protein
MRWRNNIERKLENSCEDGRWMQLSVLGRVQCQVLLLGILELQFTLPDRQLVKYVADSTNFRSFPRRIICETLCRPKYSAERGWSSSSGFLKEENRTTN